jgi:uncharacterized membrane protein YcaP (DUF421 family)
VKSLNYLEVLGKVIISFAVLLLMTRMMGKKQVGQLTYFNYITGISIGAIAASITIDRSINMWEGFVGLIGWALLTHLVAFINLKSRKARGILNGQPTILIKNGNILEKAMEDTGLNMDDLSMLLREKDIFSVKEADYAILEPDGKLSVLKKVDQQNPSKKDLHVKIVKPMYIPTEIIVDGTVVSRNLSELNLSEKWLQTQLEQAGANLKDIFYAEIQSDGTLFIDKNDHP